uniref:Uncharacterized protein n=1 Tax=Plectus sambesii TaxID=2011161 RepID=A0A914W8W9_9BILA
MLWVGNERPPQPHRTSLALPTNIRAAAGRVRNKVDSERERVTRVTTTSDQNDHNENDDNQPAAGAKRQTTGALSTRRATRKYANRRKGTKTAVARSKGYSHSAQPSPIVPPIGRQSPLGHIHSPDSGDMRSMES